MEGTLMMDTMLVEIRGQGRNVKELTKEEKSFLDCVLDGMGMTDAMFASGLFPKEKEDDKATREKASQKANYLINTKRASIYIAKNRKTAVIYTENDLPGLMTHIYEIAMGNATTEVVTVKGEVVTVHPSFKDQISAASLIRNYTNDLKKDAKFSPVKKDKKKAVDAVALEFVSKYKTRKVDDGFMKGKVTDRNRINNDAFIEVNGVEIDEEPESDISQL